MNSRRSERLTTQTGTMTDGPGLAAKVGDSDPVSSKGSPMFYHDKRLQYPVRVENPDPLYARQLQQAIRGIEGEIRVCLQYFFRRGAHELQTTNIATCF